MRILELLADQGELAVGDLVAQLGLSQPNVSNHLACLRWCRFVATRREHRSILYRIADERVEALLELGRSLLADHGDRVDSCPRVDRGRGVRAAIGGAPA